MNDSKPDPAWRLSVSAGVGPDEAQRFAVLLARELEQICVVAGLELVSTADMNPDSSEGVGRARSPWLELRGDRYVVTPLLGTHALLLDARRARAGHHRGHRKRWFVRVFTSDSTATVGPQVLARDVEFQFSRAGGPGGQHVNTTSTAVRAVHRPSGIAVRVSDSRSQSHNRALALERIAEQLRARELETQRGLEHDARDRCLAVVRGEPIAVWRLCARPEGLRAVSPAEGRGRSKRNQRRANSRPA